MNRKIAVFIVLLAFVSPKVVLAQTVTSSPQTLKARIQALKEERKENIAEAKTNMEAFKARIQAIKDTRKQALTEKITDKVASTNARLTNRMNTALDHLRDILNRVKEKEAVAKAEGKDTAALDQAILKAESAIETARTAVSSQSAKTYTPSIVDEPTLKNTIGQMVSEFRKDISAVHKLIVDAKQAVMKTINESAKLKGKDNVATPSSNI